MLLRRITLMKIGLTILILALTLVLPALVVAQEEPSRHSFATDRGPVSLQVTPGGEARGEIYFYNVDGNRTTYITLEVAPEPAVPAGWEVEIDPPKHEIQVSFGGDLGRVHTKQRIGDQSEIDEKHEHYVELIESREDSTIALQPPEKPFYLISPLVHLPIVFPRRNSGRLGWHHWSHAKIQDQLTSFFSLICTIHDNEVGL